MRKEILYAKKTFLAMKNPYNSITKVFPLAINSFEKNSDTKYLGVKDVPTIPLSLVHKLEANHYVLHTLDKSSRGGRAVDYDLENPISGHKMTGSSSGTAINVFLGINDLGIGNDGGGSVLAPAMAVNCFGFISSLLETEYMKQFERLSTDNISFNPSLGYIARDFAEIKNAIECTIPLKEDDGVINCLIPDAKFTVLNKNINDELKTLLKDVEIKETSMPEFTNDRKPLIEFLSKVIKKTDVFVSYEAKIDVEWFGDTVLGHFDEIMASKQLQSGKFLTRVANMVKATTITVPSKEFASAYTLFCEPKEDKIAKMLKVAEMLVAQEDELLDRYFRNVDQYFSNGILDYKNIKQ